MIPAILKNIRDSFFDLIYPPLCLHCRDVLGHDCPIFCSECLKLMTPINAKGRCPYCFSSSFNELLQKCCQSCMENPLMINQVASVFDYEGPPATLVKHLKYGGQAHLAKGGGAYLAAQFLTLEWPIPDFIIPMPSSRLRKLERGYNQSWLLSEAFANIIDRPIVDALKRRSGAYSQAGLNLEQRQELSDDSFVIKNNIKFYGKTILLIDDVMTTGSSLRCCAEALKPAFPEAVYAITLCRTL